MISFLLSFATAFGMAAQGPIPTRIGAVLEYEAVLPTQLPGSMSTELDLEATDDSWLWGKELMVSTTLQVRVLDTTRSDSGRIWGVELQAGGGSLTERVELLERANGSWSWTSASCLFPVDAEPGVSTDAWTYDLDHNGALALGCSPSYADRIAWRTPPTLDSLPVWFESSPVEWQDAGYFVVNYPPPIDVRQILCFECAYNMPPPIVVHREGVGVVRMEDHDAPMRLKLVAVDGVPVPEDWDPPPPPPPPPPVVVPQSRPRVGSLWVWVRTDSSWYGDTMGPGKLVEASPLDTVAVKLLELRDSTGWTLGVFHVRKGLDAPAGTPFTLRWNAEGQIQGDREQAPGELLSTLVRLPECYPDSGCVKTISSWSDNGGLGPNQSTRSSGTTWTWKLGVGLVRKESWNRQTTATWLTSKESSTKLVLGPDSLASTLRVVRPAPAKARSLSLLVREHPEARFTVWSLDGNRQEATGREWVDRLGRMRGTFLWSATVSGKHLVGKHTGP